ncbi:MAG: DMT family transporter [Firmicutes bacterium]|nr:DMT family transporter [Bacillota bacterium]
MKNFQFNKFCLFMVLQCILYGLGDPISKAAYETVEVYSLLSVRYTIAFIVFMLFAGRRIVYGLKTTRIKVWLLPSLCVSSSYIFNNMALSLTAATNVAFIGSLSVILTPILAFFIYRIKFSRKHIPVLVMIVLGLYLLCGHGGLSGFGLGEVYVLITAVSASGSLVFGSKALEKMDPITLSAVQTLLSAVIVTVCAIVFDGGISLSSATGEVWTVILYLAVGCTFLGYILQNMALEKISARTVALIQCLYPVMTAIFSYIILGETLSLAGVTGAAIILACVIAETFLTEEY